MALAKNLFSVFLYHLLLFNRADSQCQPSFDCGALGSLEFPLARDPGCGLFTVDGCDSESQRIQLEYRGRWYDILHKVSTNGFFIQDPVLKRVLDEENCHFPNMSLPKSPYSSFIASPNLTLFRCNQSFGQGLQGYFPNYAQTYCSPYTLYYRNQTDPAPGDINIPPECQIVQVPTKLSQVQDSNDPFDLFSAEFNLEWHVSEDCYECHRRGGQCRSNATNEFFCDLESYVCYQCHRGGGQCRLNATNEFYCERKGKSRKTLILAICIPGAAVLLLLSITYIIWQRKKKSGAGYLLSRSISTDPSSKSDIEGGSFSFGIPVFSYTELEVATNNFDPSKELGDGGFGTVYYGKLRDGRDVAIKRLYEHSYKRVERFLNEIEILTRLRHTNLVSLYGCTSKRSQELLLVYEYISNGTVADHLYGERAKEALLTWPIRMNIAIEIATALAYLHKWDIIHRDVKTSNILLDNNFCVKVADFGLSVFVPVDVTHIFTAPQGTPGYVDPQYHQFYQLTDKSDVYSFGVVLIELISSMPAVHIGRYRTEINLANLAVNRIQRCAFNELINPSLGYDSDPEVTRMTTSVAGLAFRCLQLKGDMRPCMEEVLAFLKGIQAGEVYNFEQIT